MMRSIGAALALAAVLSPAGERIESTYPEGALLTWSQTGSSSMVIDEVHVSVDDTELPPEVVKDMGMEVPSSKDTTTCRGRDEVLEAAEGRPVRVRRLFEELRKHSVENGEEKEKTGPVEGLALLLSEEDGTPVAKLEDSESEIDARYLSDHRLARDTDFLLPQGEIEVGAEWELEESQLRLFMGIESAPLLFEPDEGEENDPFEQMMDKAATLSGKARLIEIEERDGLRCAVIGFTVEIEASVDDLESLHLELEEGMQPPAGSIATHLVCEGKLWHALAERRPVALEQTLQGTLTMQMVMRLQVEEEVELSMKVDMQGSFEGEDTTTWTAGE